ncbi:DUF4230 domain-containing protein [Aquimarina sp. ERC-38]|uniref:DUF4230 domain-containing protein n=1 Tax=Aquimarina sp. ERC-38 TaxID=2949996 RepID=UPI002247D7CE|nr:DUF4230 domain-containing protein [Aquimarina sp. ERC-38]UZO81146.1 DUF4230 domain-containing protein [Aquimarina sp. ERC-38]
MRNFFLGCLLTFISAFAIYHFIENKKSRITQIESTELLLHQINNVGKLIVTEGHFSEVITYKDAKKLYMDFLTAEKKAIVVVNAKATVSYDLHQIKHTIDTKNKTVTLTEIPKAELQIDPKITYHDMQQDYLNRFTPEDHNTIRKQLELRLQKKIEQSTLLKNAENRLLSELQKIYLLTSSLDWTLQYNGKTIKTTEDLIL